MPEPRAAADVEPNPALPLPEGLAFLDLLDTMPADEVRARIEDIEGGFAVEGQRRRLLLLVGRWAMLEPEAAVRYALHDGPESLRGALALAALTGWARHDPSGAYGWYRARAEDLNFPTNSVSLRPILAVTAQHWARIDPEAAVAALAEAPAGEAFHIWRGVGQTAARDAPARTRILRAILALPDEGARAGALGHVLSVWKSRDPEAAEAWIAEAEGL